MKKIIVLSVMLFFKNINCLDGISLKVVHKDVRNHVLLPLLLQLKNDSETKEEFLERIKKEDDIDPERQKDVVLRELPSKFSALKFDTLFCKASRDSRYLGVLEKKTQYDVLKIYHPFEKQDLIYEEDLEKDVCHNLILSNDGLCIVCLNRTDHYELRLINVILRTSTFLTTLAKHPNTEFAKANKPRLFLNKQETMLAVQRKKPCKTVPEIDFTRLKTGVFIERLAKLRFWKSYEENLSITDLLNPNTVPRTLDELFRRLGICKKIDQPADEKS